LILSLILILALPLALALGLALGLRFRLVLPLSLGLRLRLTLSLGLRWGLRLRLRLGFGFVLSLLLFLLLKLSIDSFSGEPIPFLAIEGIGWDFVSRRDQGAHDDLIASFVPVIVVSSLAAKGMEKPDVKELLTIDRKELGIAELFHIGGIIIHVLSIRGHGLSLSFGLSERHPKG
jgi:hypothetical protein